MGSSAEILHVDWKELQVRRFAAIQEIAKRELL